MKFIVKPSPNYYQKQSTKSIMFELTIGLLLVYAFSLFYYFTSPDFGSEYGIHIILMMLVSVGVACGTEVVWALIKKEKPVKYLLRSFPWVTGIIVTLVLSVNVSLYAVAVGTFLAILLGKLVFGGFGQNFINPAGLARVIIVLSLSASAVDLVTGATPATTINGSGWLLTNEGMAQIFESFGGISNMLIGLRPGAIGETSILLMIVIGIYFSIRRIINWRTPVFYLGSIFVITTIIGLMNGVGFTYPLFHLLSGGVVFAAVFMLTDPVTNPTSNVGQVIFAIGAAILTVLMRIESNMPEGVVFAILIMNVLTPLIEKVVDYQQVRGLNKFRIYTASMAVLAVVVAIYIGSGLTPANAEEPEPEKPTVTLNDKKVKLSDEDINRYEATILSVTEGNPTVYVVQAEGYGLVDDDGSHGGDYGYNEFTISVDPATKEVVAFEFTTFGDTNGIGSKADNEAYFDVIIGLKLDSLDTEVETVTGATMTSNSIISALKAVALELSK